MGGANTSGYRVSYSSCYITSIDAYYGFLLRWMDISEVETNNIPYRRVIIIHYTTNDGVNETVTLSYYMHTVGKAV